MPSTLRVRSALPFAAVVLAAALAGCAEPPPPAMAQQTAPPVTMSSRTIELASGYRAYMSRTGAISPAFADGTAVASSVTTGAAYDPRQFLRGAIAYGAVVALQDPTFVAGVRASANDRAQRQEVAYAILRDPAYVAGLPGASSAAGAIVAALGTDGRALYDQGGRVKQAAYDIQASAWSKAEVPNRPMRLQQVKAAAAGPLMGDLAESQRLRLAATGALPATPATPASPPYSSFVVRALGVAALAALGYDRDGQTDMVTPLMADAVGGTCLNLAKLNLYQCLAVSKPHYEDVFCLGQHAMMDTGVCVMKSAGAALPLEVKTKPLDVSLTSKPYKAAPKPKARPKAKTS